QRFPELREEFRERILLASGDVTRLVAQARRDIRERTAEAGWSNHWSGEGFTADFSGLRHRLERLLELGHADAVVGLGREFIERAMDQVGQSDDEGETAKAVAECLPVIFQAVAASALAPVDKILFAIDALLQDDYGVIGDAADAVLEAPWKREDWSAVADRLAARLRLSVDSEGEAFSERYRRN